MPSKDLLALTRQSKYALDAFVFVQRGLEYTVSNIHGEVDDIDDNDIPSPSDIFDQDSEFPQEVYESRHVSGAQLCEGLRDYAISQYGLLARTVLRHWHVSTCEDFGNIVFEMVDAGLMHKTDDDSIEDFINVFDFREAFSREVQLN
ncbi:Minf_1886 family protein [Poriferisphaera sp. WC338]|uniref:Minf_1886 family protein n=1 Tax=Poriferisphaera sp. WC338 TaxID=3425129 RepID=UPI003D81C067